MRDNNDSYYIRLEDVYGYTSYENKINVDGSVLFFLESKSLKTYIVNKYGVEALKEVPEYLFLNHEDFYKKNIEYIEPNISIFKFKEEMTDVKIGGLEDELFLPNQKDLYNLLNYSPSFSAIKHINCCDQVNQFKKYSKSKQMKLAKYILEFKELTRLRKESIENTLNIKKELIKSNREIRKQMIYARHIINNK